MHPRLLLIAAAGLACLAAAGATHPRDREVDNAYRGTREGRILPLRRIEDRIVPAMGEAEYLGPELDPAGTIYRLKFMRGGRVIWIDVDARTGQVIGRSGR